MNAIALSNARVISPAAAAGDGGAPRRRRTRFSLLKTLPKKITMLLRKIHRSNNAGSNIEEDEITITSAPDRTMHVESLQTQLDAQRDEITTLRAEITNLQNRNNTLSLGLDGRFNTLMHLANGFEARLSALADRFDAIEQLPVAVPAVAAEVDEVADVIDQLPVAVPVVAAAVDELAGVIDQLPVGVPVGVPFVAAAVAMAVDEEADTIDQLPVGVPFVAAVVDVAVDE